MFTIKNFSDVLNVAKTFGVDSLSHIIENETMGTEANQIIRDAYKWAANKTVTLESVNDGNIEYYLDAECQRESLVKGVYSTTLEDIVIVRYGFGSFRMSAREAMNKGEITKEQLAYVLDVMRQRNNAFGVLGC